MPFLYNSGPPAWTLYSNTVQPIVTNLFLNLDANAYSGAGSTWYDSSGNSRNATLVNGPTYSSSQGGCFHFTDTSLQYAITSTVPSLTNWTVEAWFRPTKSLTSKVTSIVSNEFDLINKLNYSLGTNNAPGSYNLAGGFYNGAWRTTTGFAPTNNTWCQSVVTYNGSVVTQYQNGTSQSTLTYAGTSQSGGAIRIARRWDEALTSANLFDGDISIVRVYDTSLSSTQVFQNYNAIKTRYGL